MITITANHTPILFTNSSTPRVRTARRRVLAVLRRIGEAPRRRPTPSEQVLDDLQGVDTLRRW